MLLTETANKEVLQLIIDHGTDVNVVDKDSMTALMIACWKGNTDAINILLNAGADPDIANANRDTCLIVATDRSLREDLLQTLIDHGAKVNATNKQNLTALMVACWKGNTNAINVLLSAQVDPNIANANGDTCLTVATDRSLSKDMLQALIDRGAKVNASNKQSLTALMVACWKCNTDAINLLLNAGADPNIAHTQNDACLTTDTDRSFSNEVPQESVDYDASADVNAAKKRGITALWIACHQGDIDTINALISAGADPNIAHANGDTCLKHAIDRGCSTEVLHLLIAHGADVNATNKQNVTALLSVCRRMLRVSPRARTRTISIRFKFRFRLIIQGNVDALNALLNAGADPNIVSINGQTCLHTAVYGQCCKEVLQALIDHGADVNAANKSGVTALWIACHQGDIAAINVLLSAGADPKIVSSNGQTCLHSAVHGRCHKEVLQALIDHGPDVNVANNDKETGLLIACQLGTIDAINVLLNAGQIQILQIKMAIRALYM